MRLYRSECGRRSVGGSWEVWDSNTSLNIQDGFVKFNLFSDHYYQEFFARSKELQNNTYLCDELIRLL